MSGRARASANAAISAGGAAPRVLLADDDDLHREREIRMLRKLGCCVSAFRHGAHVLEAIEEVPIDIIVMDCRLRGLDGLETSREIRRMRREAEAYSASI